MQSSWTTREGCCWKNEGEVDKALETYEQALEIKKTNLGPRHTSVANTLNNMAIVFEAQGKLDKALETYEQALEIKNANQGPRHTSVGDTLNNMAGVFKAQGKLDKAFKTCEQALEIYDAHEQSREDAKKVRAAMASLKRRRGGLRKVFCGVLPTLIYSKSPAHHVADYR